MVNGWLAFFIAPPLLLSVVQGAVVEWDYTADGQHTDLTDYGSVKAIERQPYNTVYHEGAKYWWTGLYVRSKSPVATENLLEHTDDGVGWGSEHPTSVLSGWQPATAIYADGRSSDDVIAIRRYEDKPSPTQALYWPSPHQNFQSGFTANFGKVKKWASSSTV